MRWRHSGEHEDTSESILEISEGCSRISSWILQDLRAGGEFWMSDGHVPSLEHPGGKSNVLFSILYFSWSHKWHATARLQESANLGKPTFSGTWTTLVNTWSWPWSYTEDLRMTLTVETGKELAICWVSVLEIGFSIPLRLLEGWVQFYHVFSGEARKDSMRVVI